MGVDAFLPGSQVDIGPVRNLEDYLGTDSDFKILKIDVDRRNIVLSRRELLEAARADFGIELAAASFGCCTRHTPPLPARAPMACAPSAPSPDRMSATARLPNRTADCNRTSPEGR